MSDGVRELKRVKVHSTREEVGYFVLNPASGEAWLEFVNRQSREVRQTPVLLTRVEPVTDFDAGDKV